MKFLKLISSPLLNNHYRLWNHNQVYLSFLSGKVRADFKEIVHTLATVQTIDVCMLNLLLRVKD